MRNRILLIATLLLTTGASLPVFADVGLGEIFDGDMVLQRELPVPIWGKADPGEQVTVEFAGQTKTTTAGDDGKWRVVLDPLETDSEGKRMTIRGRNEIVKNNILLGEVWVCAGQSNMADRFAGGDKFPHGEKDLSLMRFHNRRKWVTVSKRTANRLSRVAYFFGHRLEKELEIPIGLIPRHNGGTPIQAWMSFEDSEVIRKELGIPEDWREQDKNQRNPAYQYEDKLEYAIPYAIRGAVWYQGERNAKAATAWEYDRLLAHHIRSWRKDWGERAGLETRKFPFYYVQIPTDQHKRDYEFPWVRDRQRRALDLVENAGMAIVWETGPSLHPHNKELIGERLAGIALARDYGRDDLVYSGPLLKDAVFKNGKAILSFRHVDGGLKSRGGGKMLDYFELAGADIEYHPARASIAGDKVLVASDEVSDPKYVRYLFNPGEDEDGHSDFSLMNAAGIPASSFITDDELPAPRKGD